MPETHLIAVDPGKLSGFVILDITQTLVDDSQPVIVESSERDQLDVCYTIHDLISKPEDGRVYKLVCEDFFITPQTGKKKDTRYSLEIIGTLRYLCRLYSVPFSLQSPSEGKSFSTDERLKSMGLYVAGGKGHMRDAMRHAIYYMVFMLDRSPKGVVIQ